MSAKKATVWCIAAALLIAPAAIWLPALSFWWLFQKVIEGYDPGGAVGAVLWARVAEAEGRPSGRAGGAAESPTDTKWGRVLTDGLLVPLPPGDVTRIGREGATLVVEYRSGRLTVDRFAAGTILGVYREALIKVGGSRTSEAAPGDDRTALKAATIATPRDFDMGLDAASRNRYAASVLTKLRIWEYPGAETAAAPSGAGRHAGQLAFHAVRSADGHVEGSLLGSAGAHGRVIVVLPDSVLSIGMKGSFPADWLAEPDRWAEIAPARAEAVSSWQEEIRRHHGAGHPLRVWADGAAAPEPLKQPGQPGQPVQPPPQPTAR